MLDDGNELIVSQKLDDNGQSYFDATIYDPRAQSSVFNLTNSALDSLLNDTSLGKVLKDHGMSDGAVTSFLKQTLKFDFSIPISDNVDLDIGADAATSEISIGIDIKF